MNATILLRIMPDLRSKYSLIVDGERLGDMKTLNNAIAARDCLKEHDFTMAEARAILQGEDSFNLPFHRPQGESDASVASRSALKDKEGLEEGK